MSSDNWYYKRGADAVGPVSLNVLRGMLRSGQIDEAELVWADGMPQWMPAAALGALADVLREAPAQSSAPRELEYGLTPSHYLGAATIEYATFWQRFVAMLIDSVLLQVLNSLLRAAIIPAFYALDVPLRGQQNAVGALIWAATICVQWLYAALMESSRHQATLGKMAMKLIVTDTEGRRISFARATGRHFGKILSSIFFIGYLVMISHPRKQTWHDRLAGTLVLRRPR
jgi:uncharacterized RDD family membrane protein YckC